MAGIRRSDGILRLFRSMNRDGDGMETMGCVSTNLRESTRMGYGGATADERCFKLWVILKKNGLMRF